MTEITKGRSPFYPGQPVPVELFVGRQHEIELILKRGAGQVAAGKPIALFVEGEYGIGKSSIAKYTQSVAKLDHHLHPIYSQLTGAKNLTDVAAAILKATVESVSVNGSKADHIKRWLSKYIDKTTLFGVTVNLQAVKADAQNLSTPDGLLRFLAEVLENLKKTHNGLFLVIDEINGIAANPDFAHFLKGLIDLNAMADRPLPLLLMLCGVAERRRALIQCYEPVARVFDVIDVENMSGPEMEEFFSRAFEAESHTVTPEAMRTMTQYSAGIPKIMHMIGDNAYWTDKDGVISQGDALTAVVQAIKEFNSRLVPLYLWLRSVRDPRFQPQE